MALSKKLSVRLTATDERNLRELKKHLGLLSDSEAIRMALHAFFKKMQNETELKEAS